MQLSIKDIHFSSVGLERVGIDLPLYLESNAAYRDVNRRQPTFSNRIKKQLIKKRERERQKGKKADKIWPVPGKDPKQYLDDVENPKINTFDNEKFHSPDDFPKDCRASSRQSILDSIVQFLPAVWGCSGSQTTKSLGIPKS